MTKTYFYYIATGILAGLVFSVAIFLTFWVITMECQYGRKVFYYEGFLFREKCRQEGKSDLQAATERYRVIHNQPNFKAGQHPDVRSGHPEAFIRGTLGYNLWDGFCYGQKPGRLETFFELRTIKDTFSIMAMMLYLPFIAILITPFAGGLIGGFIGLVLNKKHCKRAIDTPGGFLYNSSNESR